MKKTILFLLAGLLFSTSCDRGALRPGEVALVNGVPITLRELQATHDAQVIGGDNPGRAMETLRMEYGAALSELIIQELAAQELAEHRLTITDEELAQAEQEIRQDYPPGDFDRMLLEESLDLDLWRNALRKRLGMAKFNGRLLRAQVSIGAAEVEEYYLAHEEEFKIPERISFIQFSSRIKEEAAGACAQFQKNQDPEAIQARFPNVNISKVVMRKDRLDPALVKALGALKPMETSAPIGLNGEHVALALLGKEPARLLSREEIYSRIETILLEDKLQYAFQEWLERKIAKSHIQVSVHLLPDNLR